MGFFMNSQVKWNIFVLVLSQTFFICAISIDLTVTGVAGFSIAPNKDLATLPFSFITIAGAISTGFTTLLMHRIGHRLTFASSALFCFFGGLISAWAIYHKQFIVFCCGTACVGIFQAFSQYYRLIVAEHVNKQKGKVISMVLSGGVIAGFVGPLLASWGSHLFNGQLFVGPYLIVSILGFMTMIVFIVRYKNIKINTLSNEGKIIGKFNNLDVVSIIRRPIFMVGTMNTVISNVVMMLIMTAAPIAAIHKGYTLNDSASIMQWHLLGMFFPSLFSGWIIEKSGITKLIFIGGLIIFLGVSFAVEGDALLNFYVALLCLGIGWNFMFIGGTTIIAHSYQPHERFFALGLSEFIRYVLTAFASLMAASILNHLGWPILNMMVIPLLFIALIMTLWWSGKQVTTKPSELKL